MASVMFLILGTPACSGQLGTCLIWMYWQALAHLRLADKNVEQVTAQQMAPEGTTCIGRSHRSPSHQGLKLHLASQILQCTKELRDVPIREDPDQFAMDNSAETAGLDTAAHVRDTSCIIMQIHADSCRFQRIAQQSAE